MTIRHETIQVDGTVLYDEPMGPHSVSMAYLVEHFTCDRRGRQLRTVARVDVGAVAWADGDWTPREWVERGQNDPGSIRYRRVEPEASSASSVAPKPADAPASVRDYNRAELDKLLREPPRSALDGFGRREGPAWDAWVRHVAEVYEAANDKRHEARARPASAVIAGWILPHGIAPSDLAKPEPPALGGGWVRPPTKDPLSMVTDDALRERDDHDARVERGRRERMRGCSPHRPFRGMDGWVSCPCGARRA